MTCNVPVTVSGPPAGVKVVVPPNEIWTNPATVRNWSTPVMAAAPCSQARKPAAARVVIGPGRLAKSMVPSRAAQVPAARVYSGPLPVIWATGPARVRVEPPLTWAWPVLENLAAIVRLAPFAARRKPSFTTWSVPADPLSVVLLERYTSAPSSFWSNPVPPRAIVPVRFVKS